MSRPTATTLGRSTPTNGSDRMKPSKSQSARGITMHRTLRPEGGGGRGEGEQGGWLRWRGEGVEGSGQDVGLRPLAPEETQTSVQETRRALRGHRGGG